MSILGAIDARLVEQNATRAVIAEADPGQPLSALLGSHREVIRAALLKYGIVQFRTHGVNDPDVLAAACGVIGGSPVDYKEASTPRTRVEGHVYTSTEYPADQRIPQHNECSYANSWPDHLFFLSAEPAQQGGQTPLADSRVVLEKISRRLREKIADKGVLYTRTYHPNIGLSWSEVFGTSDREAVELYCKRESIDHEWEGEVLRTRQLRPGIARHPVTGEQVWFNQANLFHINSIESNTREALLDLFEARDLPRNAYFGDGSEITDADLQEIETALDESRLILEWGLGDLRVIDNMLVSHGREPYKGTRKLLVTMSQATWGEWATSAG